MIAILMATYNGEKYLKEQIDSIVKQSNTDWTLFIHDDGSGDSTLNIIKEYSYLSSNIVLLEDEVKHRGAAQSFMWLLSQVEADYYMFCDQDDIWLSNKVSDSFDAIKKMERDCDKDTPLLVHSDLFVVDKNNKMLESSMWKISGIYPKLSSKFNFFFIYNNCFTGCTMLFNDSLKNKSLPMHPMALMHDWWIGLNAIKYGCINSLSNPAIRYRQHENNTVGASSMSNIWKDKIMHLNETIANQKKIFPLLTSFKYGGRLKFCFFKFVYNITIRIR